jgi:hypothetical protein
MKGSAANLVADMTANSPLISGWSRSHFLKNGMYKYMLPLDRGIYVFTVKKLSFITILHAN